MSNTVQEEVLRMKFDNEDFEKNVQVSLATLEDLKKSLNTLPAVKSLDGISKAVSGVDFSGMETAIESVSNKFNLLGIIGMSAIQKITQTVMSVGGKWIKSLSLDQVTKGFDKYAQITSSVQTILAATKDQGENIKSVTDQVNKLLWFTDETSYNLVDMTNNIAKFTSNGIRLSSAVTQMQGIATAAALAGANSTDASHAMEGFSKAMGAGAMKLQHWHFIQTAHMDTVQFKQSLIDAAVELGTLQKVGEGVYKTLGKGNTVMVNDFTSAMKDGWMTANVMQKALANYGKFSEELYATIERFDGKITASELLTYIEEFRDGTLDISKLASDLNITTQETESIMRKLSDASLDLGERSFRAAQEAKTFKEAIDSVTDAVSSGWMKTFELIFGNYEEAKKLWTGVANAMYDVFAEGGNIRNEILAQWKEMGGRNSFLTSIANTINAFGKPFQAAKAGLNSLFPDVEGMAEILYKLTTRFEEFTSKLGLGSETLQAIYEIFRALGTTLKLVLTLVSSVIKALSPALKPISMIVKQTSIFITYVARVITYVEELLMQSGAIQAIAEKIASVLSRLGDIIGFLSKAIVVAFLLPIAGIVIGVTKLVQKIKEWSKESKTLQSVLNFLAGGLSKIVSIGGMIVTFVSSLLSTLPSLSTVIDTIALAFTTVTIKIGEFFSSIASNQTLITAFTNVLKTLQSVFGMVAEKVTSAFSKVTESLSSFSKVGDLVSSKIKGITEAFSKDGLLGIVNTLQQTMSGKLLLGVTKFSLSFGALGRLLPAKLGIIGAAISKILPLFITFAGIPTLLSPISDKAGVIIDSLIGKFQEFISSTNKFKYISDTLKKMGNNITSTFKGIFSSSESIAVTFGKNVYNAMLNVVKAFKDAVSTAGLLRKGVSAHELTAATGLDEMEAGLAATGQKTTILTEIIDKIRGVFEKIPQPVKDATTAIVDFFKNLDPGQIVALAFTGTMLAMISSLGKFIKATTSVVDSVNTNVVGKVGGVLDGLKGVITDFRNLPLFKKQKEVKQTFKDFAEGIAMIAACVGILSLLPQDELKSATTLMIDLMFTFVGLYAAVLALTSILGAKGLNPSAAIQSISTMVGMVAAIAILAGTMLLIKDMAIDDTVGEKLLLIAALGVTIVGLMALMSKVPKGEGSALKQALIMLAFAFAIKSVIVAYKDISEIPTGQILESIPLFIAMIGGIALLSAAVGQIKITSVIALVLLVKVFNDVFEEMKDLAKTMLENVSIGWDKITNITDDQMANLLDVWMLVVAAAATLAFLFSKMSEAIGSVAKGVISLAIAVAIITKVAETWKLMDWNQFKQVAILVAECLLGFGAIMVAASTLKIDKKTQKLAIHIGRTALALTVAFGMMVGLSAIVGMFSPTMFKQAAIMIGLVGGIFATIVGLTKLTEKANPKILTAIAASIIALLASLIVLSVIKPERLIAPTIAISAVMAAFAVVISQVGRLKPNKNAFANMVMVAGMLGVIALTLYMISKECNWDSIAATGAAMMAAFIGLSFVLKQVTKMEPNKQAFLALVGVTTTLATIGLTLGIVSKICNWDSIAATGAAMMAAFIGLSFVLKQVATMKPHKGAFLALVGVAIAIVALGGALALISINNWDSILASGAAMSGAIVAFMFLIKAIDSSKLGNGTTWIKKIISLAAAAGIVLALAGAMTLLARFSWESIAVSMLAISASVLALIAAVYLMSKTNIDFAKLAKFGVGLALVLGSLLVVAYLIPQLAEGLRAMETVNWESIGKAAVAFLATVGILTTMGAIIGKLGAGAMAGVAVEVLALAFCVDLIAGMAESLQKMDNVSWESIGKTAVGILATVGLLSGLGVAIAVATGGAGIFGLAAELLALAFCVDILAGLATSLSSFATLDWATIGKAALAIVSTVGILSGLGVAITLATAGLGVVGLAAELIALAVCVPILEGLAKSLMSFQAVEWSDIGQAAVAILALGGALSVLAVVSPLVVIGSLALTVMTGVMALAGPVISDFAIRMSEAAIKIATAVLVIKQAFSKSADMGIKGMAEGVQKNGNTIAKLGASIGNIFLKSFYAVVGQHSPWDTMIAAMNYMAAGVTDGVNKVKGFITGDGAEAGSSFISGMWETIKGGIGKIGSLIKDAFAGFGIDLSFMDGVGEKLTDFKDVITGDMGIEDFVGNLIDTDDILAQVGIDTESLIPDLDDLSAGIGGVGDAAEGAGKKAKDAKNEFEKFKESLYSNLESKTGGMNFFNKLELKTETTAQSILDNMKSNIDGVASWTARLAQVAEKGLDQGLIKVLAEAGVDSYDQVSAFLQMSDEQIAQANEMFKQQAAGRAYAVNTIGDSYLSAGKNITKGLENGVREGQQGCVDAIAETDEKMQNKLETDFKIASPSGVTRDYGMYIDLGLMGGISSYASRVTSVVAALCRQVKYYFEDGLRPEWFESLGRNIMEGLTNGIETKGSVAIERAEEIATKVGEIMAKALQVESPSKVTRWIGNMVGLGLEKGLDDSSKSVEESAYGMADSVLTPLQAAIKDASSYVSNHMDLNPTITPMLDLSPLMDQVSSIDSLFADKEMAVASGSRRTGTGSTFTDDGAVVDGNGNTNYIFNQNNYSPKALSRLDIYRDSRNLFSSMKGAVQGT